jgi:PadR family transcriptional regulator, regulatory protein PadR
MTQRLDSQLMRGSLDLMVLSVLADGPKYGYLVQRRLRESSGNLVRIEAGTLYPLLHRLESDKSIRSRWDSQGGRKRKWYELTAAGRRRLVAQASQWRQYAGCVEKMLGVVNAGCGMRIAE